MERAQIVEPGRVYALVAYLLNLGYVVGDDFVLSNQYGGDPGAHAQSQR